MIRLAETREKLIAVDLDDTFTDHTGAFREVLAQLGINVPDGYTNRVLPVLGGFSGLLDTNYAIVDVFTHKGPSDKGRSKPWTRPPPWRNRYRL